MEKRTFTERLADAQQKAKESPAFAIFATLVLITIFYLHFRYGFDRDWGATNLGLSIEAFYNGIFVLMAYAVTARLAKDFHAWLKRQIAELRKLLERLEAIFETLSLVLTRLDEIRKALRMILKYIETNQGGAA